MKIKIMLTLLITFFTSINAFAITGREIMEKNDALLKDKTSIRKSVLLIIKGGRKEKKEFDGETKRFGDIYKMRMNFKYPTRLGFLVWDEPGKDKLQWLKLTSGKVRKVASSDKDKPWMNSHFYNEDIGERHLSDYKYKLVGEGEVKGIQCYKVEAVKIKGQKVYSKTITYVGKKDWVIRKVEFYVKGRHIKTLLNDKIQKIQGIYTARKLTMIRTDGKGKSILYIKSVKYNKKVSNQKFKRESF